MTEPTPTTDPAAPPVEGDTRVGLVVYCYELLVGDLLLDTWEETERLVAAVASTTKQTTVTFADDTQEVFSRRPPMQVLDILRWRSLIPALSAAEADTEAAPAEDAATA